MRARRRKEKKVVQKVEKSKEGKGTKKELCKVENSSLFCRAPSLRTGKKTPLCGLGIRQSMGWTKVCGTA